MTFLKFQEKPKGSKVYYVYEYRSYREKREKNSSDYGKVRHALVAYHGRVDRALEKLIPQINDFSSATREKLVHYTKLSRRPGNKDLEGSLLGRKFTLLELQFLTLFVPPRKIMVDKIEKSIKVSAKDLSEIISKIEDIPSIEVMSYLNQIEKSNKYKIIIKDGIPFCKFSDQLYFSNFILSK
ncbi:MAG: hypothetical protein HeimC3_35800 [Candidatus Heimdallarchaeota archaeon LC_3]|nr:MAG: hypothetical protein HeimC3_35800 [Candidatus Heimdallarchaeota archaeon LC_3]